MRESWRWFGPNDPVTLDDIRQTGATDIVSALHDIPIGDVWPLEKIQQHKAMIEEAQSDQTPLRWTVVESIPVHEDIKLAKPGHQQYVDAWIKSMENLAECGIQVICYNFMPVIDWTRTDLRYRLPNGAYTLRFDQKRFAAFDLYILQREGAELDYSLEEQAEAKKIYEAMSNEDREQLTQTIIAGLPGRMTDAYSLKDFRKALDQYRHISKDGFRENLNNFLSQVIPVAERINIKLAIHPDDPPRDMFGLPRIICTQEDLQHLFTAQPSSANGITLCVGTYGSRPDNDLPAMAEAFGERIHFAHLRGVTLEKDEPRTFTEAPHLDSDINMVAVIRNLLKAELKRFSPQAEIFIRPDHGQQMLDDIHKTTNPGYSAIGRMKGLAEIRGVVRALAQNM